jgi:probable HAF family extracellular repeat protein
VSAAGGNKINNFGQIADGVLWTPNTPNATVGTSTALTTQDGVVLNARDVNQSGMVAATQFINGKPHAYLWKPSTPNGNSGQAQDLGNLGFYAPESYLGGLNDAGQVVGYSVIPTGYDHAFLWTPADGMVDLNTLLDSSGKGWELTEAHAINNYGQIIGVGGFDPPGSAPFGSYAYLLTPTTPIPEPDGLVLLGGIVAMASAVGPHRGRLTRSKKRSVLTGQWGSTP